MKQNELRPFRRRALTTLLVALAFVVLLVSGVMLYVSPRGYVAQTIDWTCLGLTKGQWINIHNVFAVLFLITSLLHLAFNWSIFMTYFKNRPPLRAFPKWELSVATVLMVVVWWGTVYHVPPLAWLGLWQRDLRNSWEGGTTTPRGGGKQRQSRPSSGRGLGRMTLADYCGREGLPVQEVIGQLPEEVRPHSRLRDVADQMGIPVGELVRQLSREARP